MENSLFLSFNERRHRQTSLTWDVLFWISVLVETHKEKKVMEPVFVKGIHSLVTTLRHWIIGRKKGNETRLCRFSSLEEGTTVKMETSPVTDEVTERPGTTYFEETTTGRANHNTTASTTSSSRKTRGTSSATTPLATKTTTTAKTTTGTSSKTTNNEITTATRTSTIRVTSMTTLPSNYTTMATERTTTVTPTKGSTAKNTVPQKSTSTATSTVTTPSIPSLNDLSNVC